MWWVSAVVMNKPHSSNSSNIGSPNEGLLSKSQCVYTKCYCEENVWKLCEKLISHHYFNNQETTVYAAFISNSTKSVALWSQTSGDPNNNGLIVWDYHVVTVVIGAQNSVVYDLDSTLPFPCSLQDYISQTFHPEFELKKRYKQYIRMVPAIHFLAKFSSNRSHMQKSDGSWLAPPPNYPCILSSHNPTSNIDKFWSMSQSNDSSFGEVYSLQGLIKSFVHANR